MGHSVGLRPGRPDASGVSDEERIEVDDKWSDRAPDGRLVVHAYGHGGEGFQSSWGTAMVVMHLIMQARPTLFAYDQTFHKRNSQLKTDVLARAGVHQQPRAKL